MPQMMDELQNGAVTCTYAYGLQRISEDQQIGGVWTPAFYGYDGHGSVGFLTTMAGAISDTYTFDAFGNELSSTGSTHNNYLLHYGVRFGADALKDLAGSNSTRRSAR